MNYVLTSCVYFIPSAQTASILILASIGVFG